MRLLIIGDAFSPFVINFSKSLRDLDNSVIIDVANNRITSQKVNSYEIESTYRRIYHLQSFLGFIEKIPKLRGLIRKLMSLRVIRNINRNIDQYDVILIHGFWKSSCQAYRKLKTKKIFTIGAIWGSDFYKREQNDSLMLKTMDSCNLITISTEEMMKDVLVVKQIDRNKIRNCLFGLAPLNNLYQLQHISAKESKEKLGFNKNDFIITCGYNASKNQQHIRIIKSLVHIRSQLPRQTRLVLPMTYGGDEVYRLEIKKLLVGSGFNYTIYEEFLTNEMVAYLRKATDLMLQLQITDALSGSTQEHLFAHNIIVTGAWLPYQSLRKKGIYYETIEHLDELESKILYIVNNFIKIKDIVSTSNTAKKFKEALWSECIKDWYRVLNEYRSN